MCFVRKKKKKILNCEAISPREFAEQIIVLIRQACIFHLGSLLVNEKKKEKKESKQQKKTHVIIVRTLLFQFCDIKDLQNIKNYLILCRSFKKTIKQKRNKKSFKLKK